MITQSDFREAKFKAYIRGMAAGGIIALALQSVHKLIMSL